MMQRIKASEIEKAVGKFFVVYDGRSIPVRLVEVFDRDDNPQTGILKVTECDEEGLFSNYKEHKYNKNDASIRVFDTFVELIHFEANQGKEYNDFDDFTWSVPQAGQCVAEQIGLSSVRRLMECPEDLVALAKGVRCGDQIAATDLSQLDAVVHRAFAGLVLDREWGRLDRLANAMVTVKREVEGATGDDLEVSWDSLMRQASILCDLTRDERAIREVETNQAAQEAVNILDLDERVPLDEFRSRVGKPLQSLRRLVRHLESLALLSTVRIEGVTHVQLGPAALAWRDKRDPSICDVTGSDHDWEVLPVNEEVSWCRECGALSRVLEDGEGVDTKIPRGRADA